MIKKLILCMLFMLGLNGINYQQVSATNDVVSSEKLWSVKLNEIPIDSVENLSNIVVLDSNGNKVDVAIELSENDYRIVEVTPVNYFAPNVYTLKILSGFKSIYGNVLKDTIEKNFEVAALTNTNDLTGLWSTEYMHNGEVLLINAAFSSGNANVTLLLKNSGITYKGTTTYQIEDGYMTMPIEDLKTTLEGKMSFYNDSHFKVKTKGGKFAHFYK